LEYEDFWGYTEYERAPDPKQEEARTYLEKFFEANKKEVFFSRQIEVQNDAGGFALILKYQLYPWTHKELAKKVAERLGLPVDAPRQLEEGTMLRFMRWHERHL
jgi:hypothetical protein